MLIGITGWFLGLNQGEFRAKVALKALRLDLRGHQVALQKITRDNTKLRDQMTRQRILVRQTTARLNRKMERAILRNSAGGVVGNVPIIGDAADAAATAWDVWEYNEMIGSLKSLDSAFPIPPQSGTPRPQLAKPK